MDRPDEPQLDLWLSKKREINARGIAAARAAMTAARERTRCRCKFCLAECRCVPAADLVAALTEETP